MREMPGVVGALDSNTLNSPCKIRTIDVLESANFGEGSQASPNSGETEVGVVCNPIRFRLSCLLLAEHGTPRPVAGEGGKPYHGGFGVVAPSKGGNRSRGLIN